MSIEHASFPILPGRGTWFCLAMNLLCIAAIPAFWFLADAGVLAWDEGELRWSQLRSRPATDDAGVDAGSFVSLERRGCFGWCPIYRVTLYASGRVEYVGEMYVCELGPRSSLVDGRSARKLISDLGQAGFFDMRWTPTDDITDASTVITRLSIAGNDRSLRNYHGDRSAPRVLRKFEEAVDEIAGTDQWLPAGHGLDRACGNGVRIFE